MDPASYRNNISTITVSFILNKKYIVQDLPFYEVPPTEYLAHQSYTILPYI